MLHDVKNEDGIRNFFQDIYEVYIKVTEMEFLVRPMLNRNLIRDYKKNILLVSIYNNRW